MDSCSVDQCPRPILAKGYCARHYQQVARFGAVLPARPFLDEFWSRVIVNEEGCWVWTGATAGGYGQILFLDTPFPAHRIAYRLYVGEVPGTSLVCHKCDNPLCVRPDHLFLGTAADNMRDMVNKGRHPKQQASYRAKLNAAKVQHIRESQESTLALARLYGVDASTVRQVRNGETWKTE